MMQPDEESFDDVTDAMLATVEHPDFARSQAKGAEAPFDPADFEEESA